MPIYEYLCKKCANKSSIRHLIKEKPTQCPACGFENFLEKVFSMPYIVKSNEGAGKIVKAHIEDSKKELERDKKQMKEEEYE